jgi:hypothetical protein
MILVLFSLLASLGCSAAQNGSIDFNSSIVFNRIDLVANESMIIPQMSYANVENKALSSLSLLRSIPIYSSGHSVTGCIQMLQNGREHNCSSSGLSVCLSHFSLTQFLAGMPDAANVSRANCSSEIDCINGLNCTNGSGFQINNVRSGMYAAYLIDENNSKVLYALPLIVTQENLSIKVPDRVHSDDPFIPVKMSLTEPGNGSKFFAAIMLSQSDYNNFSLNLSKNKSSDGVNITLCIGDRSVQVPNPPQVSTEFLMSMLPLLPPNSAIGLQESAGPDVDLVLLTDKPWTRGNYILTCAVYSFEKGLLGIMQREVSVT